MGIAIPIQATIIPVYYLIVEMGLYDTLWALILPSIAFAIPITVLILTNFLRDVPKELYESMTVDGASDWQMFRSLVLPLAKPAVVTVGIYDALQVWNGFLFPLVLTQSSEMRVLPLSLWAYQGEFTVNIPAVLAAVMLSALPILVLYIAGRRQLISGLTAGFSECAGRRRSSARSLGRRRGVPPAGGPSQPQHGRRDRDVDDQSGGVAERGDEGIGEHGGV